ncbi:MAG TPA: hypothetical protein VHJ69_11920 [Gemmatimonadales bacterium]|nr:hypothetical protein [Gemmatimonadales bacterium]
MCNRILAVLALAGLAACSRDSSKETAIARDTTLRDLQLPPADTTRPLADRPADTAFAPAAPEPTPAAPPAAKPKPTPATPTPATPKLEAASSTSATRPAQTTKPAGPVALEAGTTIRAAMVDSITSRKNKAGEKVTARIAQDVKDASGRVAIPAGSTVTLAIAEIKESENKSDKTGKLKLTPESVTIAGKTYPINASVDSVESKLVGRGTSAGDIAKPAAGAGIGAIAGKIVGGGTGAVIGGVVGGAVGAQRMAETKDRDVVVAPGGAVVLTLRDRFIASK